MAKAPLLKNRVPVPARIEDGYLVDVNQVGHKDAFCDSVAIDINEMMTFGPKLPMTSVCAACNGYVGKDFPAEPAADDAVTTWLTSYHGTFDFVNSVKAQYAKNGRISDAQRSAIERCMARDQPKAAPKPEVKAEETTATVADFIANRIPSAHYAVASRTSGKLAFFNIDTLTEGKWAGWTFVKQVVGGHEDERVFSIRPNGTTSGNAWVIPMLEDISSDTLEAMLRYGREIGRCGHCHIALTDTESPYFKLGIGPVCGPKYYGIFL